jgi:hypothetical protein
VARRCVGSHVAVLACTLTGAGPAWADDPPKVRIVPEVFHRADGAHPVPSVTAELDGPLPASQTFVIEAPADNTRLVGADIEVWPSQGGVCAEPREPQYHHFAMIPSGTGADRVMTARIPPLQVDERFCVRLRWRAKLDSRDLPVFQAVMQQALSAKLSTAAVNGAFPASALPPLVASAGADALRDANLLGVPPSAANVPLTVALATPELDDWLKKRADANAATAAATAAAQKGDPHANELVAAAKAANDAAKAALAKLTSDIASACVADDRFVPAVELPPVLASARPGEGVTPSAGNYVSPAVGVAVTIPTAASTGRAWLFPLFGLNFYSLPVDRTIKIDDLVDNFRQRASLVVAISLKDVTLPTNQAETVILGGYPYVAFGYRVTQFVQVDAGAAVYRYHDQNPGSSALHWGLAPGLGASVDLDVLTIAKNGFSSL